MNKLIFLLFITFLTSHFSSCNKTENEFKYEVINDLLVEILGTNDYYETYDEFLDRKNTKDATYENYINNRIVDDKKKIYILMKDSTILISDNLSDKIRNKTNILGDKYKELFTNYIDDITNKKYIDLKRVKNPGKYIVQNIKNKDQILQSNECSEFIFLTVSSIKIDDKAGFGCFYLQLVKGNGASGFDSFYFINLQDQEWVIDKEINISIF